MKDWKSFADHFDPMTCVLSVEKTPEGKCGTVRVLMLSLFTPVLQVGVNFLPHLFAAGDSDEAELAKRGVVKYTFVMSFDGFHQLGGPFFEARLT